MCCPGFSTEKKIFFFKGWKLLFFVLNYLRNALLHLGHGLEELPLRLPAALKLLLAQKVGGNGHLEKSQKTINNKNLR